MLFQLQDRTLELSVEQVLRLTDTDIQHLVASQQGEQVNDPFHGSALRQLTILTPESVAVVVLDLLLPEQLDLEEEEIELAETLDVYEQVDFDFLEE